MNDVLLPIFASVMTLILTKGLDYVLASRKAKIDSVMQSLTAVDEIASAASDTIVYLKVERDAARAECERHKTESLAKDKLIKELRAALNDCATKHKAAGQTDESVV